MIMIKVWLLKCFENQNLYYMFYIYVLFYYIFIFILHVFYFCYRFLLSYFSIINLCDNVFIFIICIKVFKCKAPIKEYILRIQISYVMWMLFCVTLNFCYVVFTRHRLVEASCQIACKILTCGWSVFQLTYVRVSKKFCRQDYLFQDIIRETLILQSWKKRKILTEKWKENIARKAWCLP